MVRLTTVCKTAYIRDISFIVVYKRVNVTMSYALDSINVVKLDKIASL